MTVRNIFLISVLTLSFVCLSESRLIARRAADVSQKSLGSETSNGGETGNDVEASSAASAVTSTAVPQQTTSVNKPETAQDSNNGTKTNNNETQSDGGFVRNMGNMITNNKAMLLRTLYVLIGVTAIVLLYFGVRAWRTRRRRNKSRKYGIITSRGDLEMEPLDQDMDEDDDMTVFEMNGKPK